MKQPTVMRGPSRAELEAKNRRRRTILYSVLGVIALALIGVVAYYSRQSTVQNAADAPPQAQISVGQAAPEFSVSTTAGPFDLSAEKGKTVFLEVFATWCPHCQRMTKVLDQLYGKYNGNVRFVAVSGSAQGMDGQAENQNDVITFQQKFAVQYPVAFDPDLTVASKYLQGGFPTIVLIGPDGKIQTIGSGEIPLASLEKNLNAATAGKPVPATFS